jgi:transcriptional regulator with XRE-family HTH domain
MAASVKGGRLIPLHDRAPDIKAPDPVDIHVGAVIRTRRKALGLSRECLAVALGVTAQQIKNYETAASRISASKLFLAAKALDVRVSYFFAEIDEREAGPHVIGLPDKVSLFLDSPDGVELAAIFPKITNVSVRKQFIGLARAMAQTQAHSNRAQPGTVS